MTDQLPSLDQTIERLAADPADESAWADLYRRLWPTVFAIAYRRLRGTRAIAEDAAQEVFLRLVRAHPFGRLSTGDALRAYVHRVAENTANDYLRRALRASGVESSLDERSESYQEQADPGGAVELRDLLEDASRQLAPVDRQILQLVIEGQPLAEVAAATGLSYSNVGVRLHRLRAHLRNSLVK